MIYNCFFAKAELALWGSYGLKARKKSHGLRRPVFAKFRYRFGFEGIGEKNVAGGVRSIWWIYVNLRKLCFDCFCRLDSMGGPQRGPGRALGSPCGVLGLAGLAGLTQ